MKLTAVYRKVAEGYIGFVEELPGANSQGATLEEVRARPGGQSLPRRGVASRRGCDPGTAGSARGMKRRDLSAI